MREDFEETLGESERQATMRPMFIIRHTTRSDPDQARYFGPYDSEQYARELATSLTWKREENEMALVFRLDAYDLDDSERVRIVPPEDAGITI